MQRIKIDNIEQSNFYKMPKNIYSYILKPAEREVYMLCLENWRLSIQNGWINEKGEIYFYATQKKLSEQMNVGKEVIIRSFEKIIKLGLIQIEKEIGQPNKYYLINIDEQAVAKHDYDQSQNTTTPVAKHDYDQSQNTTTPVVKHDTKKNNKKRTNIKRINKKEIDEIICSAKYNSNKFINTFEQYLEVRTKLKFPMTSYAINLLISKINKFSVDEKEAIEVLEKSILSGWRSIFFKKENEQNGNTNYSGYNKAKTNKHIEKADRSADSGW